MHYQRINHKPTERHSSLELFSLFISGDLTQMVNYLSVSSATKKAFLRSNKMLP